MDDLNLVVEEKLPEKQIITKKTIACAVSLGTAILKEMIGDKIGKSPLAESETEELVAAALLSELAV